MKDEPEPKATRRTLLAGMALMATSAALPARAETAGGPTAAGATAGAKHVVLLGDSIFDNKRYVGDGPDVIEELKGDLPAGWTASLNAIDGSTTQDIAGQIKRLPPDATHLVVSVGGNDALKHKDMLEEKASSVAGVLDRLGKIRGEFQANYRAMLDVVLATKLPAAVCTIYEANYKNSRHAQDRGDRACRVQRHHHARGICARAAADRSSADRQRRCRLRQRGRAVINWRRQDRARSSPRSSPPPTSSRRGLWFSRGSGLLAGLGRGVRRRRGRHGF